MSFLHETAINKKTDLLFSLYLLTIFYMLYMHNTVRCKVRLLISICNMETDLLVPSSRIAANPAPFHPSFVIKSLIARPVNISR